MSEDVKLGTMLFLGSSLILSVILGGSAVITQVIRSSDERMAKMGYVLQKKSLNGVIESEWVRVGETNK